MARTSSESEIDALVSDVDQIIIIINFIWITGLEIRKGTIFRGVFRTKSYCKKVR